MDSMKNHPNILKIVCAAGLLAAAGCGDPGPREASPTERNRLVIRLFSSMEKGDPVSAAAQAAKVRALDPGNAYFAWIIEQQNCNRAVKEAQQALHAGREEEAEALLAESQRLYPMHHTVAQDLQRLRMLIALRRNVRTYRAAKTLAAREQALKDIALQAEKLRDPGLSLTVAELRRKLAASLPQTPVSQSPAVPPEPKP